MRPTFMNRRRCATRRVAAWSLVTALLLQSLIGSAATLRMWAAGHDPLLLAAGICVGQPPTPASGDGQDQGPGRATHDHQQCLLCNAGLAPGTLPVVALLPAPPDTVVELLPVPQQAVIGKDVRACPPRGPPVLA